MIRLAELLQSPRRAPTYACVYVDVIDSISHAHGPDSDEVGAEIRALLGCMERVLAPILARQKKTCILMTADHGLTAVGGEVLYVDKRVPALPGWMQTTRSGQPIAPTGGKRDLFLHVKDAHLDEAQAALTRALGDEARVLRTRDMIADGLFGPDCRALAAKLGTLMILPAAHRRAWWSGQGRFDLTEKKGDHGGLTPDEREIPFLTLPLP